MSLVRFQSVLARLRPAAEAATGILLRRGRLVTALLYLLYWFSTGQKLSVHAAQHLTPVDLVFAAGLLFGTRHALDSARRLADALSGTCRTARRIVLRIALGGVRSLGWIARRLETLSRRLEHFDAAIADWLRRYRL